jgi:hypothetical protein
LSTVIILTTNSSIHFITMSSNNNNNNINNRNNRLTSSHQDDLNNPHYYKNMNIEFEINLYFMSLHNDQSSKVFKDIVFNNSSCCCLSERENKLLYKYLINDLSTVIPINTIKKNKFYKTKDRMKLTIIPNNIINILINNKDDKKRIKRLLLYENSYLCIQFSIVLLTIYKDQYKIIVNPYFKYTCIYSNIITNYPISGSLYDIIDSLKNYSKKFDCNVCKLL